MLFAVKNRLRLTLALLAVFVLTAMWLRDSFGLTWSLEFHPAQLWQLILASTVIAASDGLLHGLLALTLGERYLAGYRTLTEFFRPQRSPQIIAGGLLAGGEELLFRGVILEGLRSAGAPALLALTVAAVLFGMAHVIPTQMLWPFAVWTVWEGALLGGVYVVSGSLAVVVMVHVLHDMGGFMLFAWQRRKWRASEQQ